MEKCRLMKERFVTMTNPLSYMLRDNFGDYVGLPSIHSTWGLAVTDDKIILTRQENDIGFKGSKLTQTVTFCSFD
jgi:hypothetical protein